MGKSNQTSSGRGPPTQSGQLATLPDALALVRALAQPPLSFPFPHLKICGFVRRKFVSFKKSIENGLPGLLSPSWSSWRQLSVLPSPLPSAHGVLLMPEMQLLDRKQEDIGSSWPGLAACAPRERHETKLLQVRVKRQGGH